jgi:phage-related minor tail protein
MTSPGGDNEIGQYWLTILPSFEGGIRKIDKDLEKVFGKVSKSAGDALSSGFERGVKEAEAAVKKSSDSIAKLRDKEAAAADKLRVAEERIAEVRDKGGSSLARAEAQRNAALRQQEAALRDIESQTKSLESAQRRLASAQDQAAKGPANAGRWLDGIKQQADQATSALEGAVSGAALERTAGSGGSGAGDSFLDGFSGGIAALGTKAGPIGMAITAAAGVALAGGTLIADQVMAGMEQEQSRANVQAKLGVDDQTMARIADAAGQAYASNFGESAAANMDAARAAIESGLLSPGASSETQSAMIAQLSTVADVLGEEIPAVARSASQAIRTGMAGDATEAFDLIVKGQQAGLNVSQDWLDTLDEYGTQFRKLGLSGTETLGLLSQMTKAGARDTDIAADALKEFSIRAIDGSEATNNAFAALGLDWQRVPAELAAGGERAHNAFGQVLDAIRQIEDPVQRASIQVALFGTQAEDLGDASNAMNLSTAVEQLGNVEGAAQRASDTMGGTTASAVESARRALETGAASMQSSLAEAFGPAVNQLATWLVENQDDVTGFFTTAANAGAEFGAVTISMASGVLHAFGSVVSGIGDGVGMMLNSFEAITGGAASIADAVGLDGLAGDLRGAQQYLADLSDDAFGTGDGITSLANTLDGAASRLHNFDANLGSTSTSAQNTRAQIDGVAAAMAGLPGGKQIDINAVVVFKDQQGRAIDPSQLLGFNPRDFATAGDAQRARRGESYNPGAATPSVTSATPSLAAGPSTAPLPSSTSSGGGASSSASADEPLPNFDRSLWGVDAGTGYPGDAALLTNVPAGRYTQDQRGDLTQGLADCSSAVEDLVNLMDGRPTGGASMSTGNADEWLRARGFVPGVGGPGDFRVGFNAGHMQATLPGGTPFNWGSDAAAARGGVGGTGADDPAFTSHYYRPVSGSLQGPDVSAAASAEIASGGYEVDPQDVYDAETAVLSDRNELEQKRLRLLELQAKGNATQSQLLAAQNDIAEQERALHSSEMKAAEARRGQLQKAPTSGGGKNDLSPIGSIFSSFLTETFGLDGSIFPDIGNLMPVQMLGTLLGAFKGPIESAMGGGAGTGPSPGQPQDAIAAGGQPQAGWNPGMPAQNPGGHGGLPFGMIPAAIEAGGGIATAATPPPAPSADQGGFGPVLGGPTTNDYSRTNNVNVSASPGMDAIGNVVRRQMNNVERLHTYAPRGS